MTAAAGGHSPPGARALGAATLGLALLALATDLRRARKAAALKAAPLETVVPAQAGTHTEPERKFSMGSRLRGNDVGFCGNDVGLRNQDVARTLHTSAALLATSVLADSALEHYRGGFENPGMLAPLATAALAIAAGGAAANGRPALARSGAYAAALAVGLAGTAFHAYNVTRRPGGLSWANLFYAAPLGAPAALALAGLLGGAARRVEAGAPALAGMPPGRALCALAGAGLAGTSAEAALLHFRGAFHNPAMWLPVTLPPLSAALMGAAALAPPRPRLRSAARAWLRLTAMLGVAGTALHAAGVARQMGGWRNWSQNLLAGPPLPAPPSFSALALAGAGALALLEREAREAA